MSNFDLNISVLTPGPGTADGCLDLDVTLSVVRAVRGGGKPDITSSDTDTATQYFQN